MAHILDIRLDHGREPRIFRDRVAVTVPRGKPKGSALPYAWDLPLSPHIVQDIETGVVIRRPYCLDDEWKTVHTGNYAKISRWETTVAGDADWMQDEDFYFISRGTAPAPIKTIRTDYAPNKAWIVSCQIPGTDDDEFPHISINFGGYKFVIWSNGAIEFFDQDNNFIGSGELSQPSAMQVVEAKKGQRRTAMANKLIEFQFIPAREDEIWVRNNQRGALNLLVPPKETGDTSKQITASSGLEVWVINGQAKIRIAEMKFYATPVAYSLKQTTREVLEEGAPSTTKEYWVEGWGNELEYCDVTFELVQEDLVTPFVPDGTITDFRVKATFTGTSCSTAFLIGFSVIWPCFFVMSNGDEEFSLYDYGVKIGMDFGDGPGDHAMDLAAKDVPTLDTLASRISVISNRSFSADIRDTDTDAIVATLMLGRTNEPHWTEEANDELSRLRFGSVQDLWKAMALYMIVDPVPYDKWKLHEFFADMVMMCGFDEDWLDIEEFDLTLDLARDAAVGDWAIYPKPGDNPADWVEQVAKDFCATHIIGWYPDQTSAHGYVFRVRSRSSFGDVEANTIYVNADDARAALMADPYDYDWPTADDLSTVIRCHTFEATTFEPEANDIRAVGWDYRRREAIAVHLFDEDSQDPTLAPSARPDNHVGEKRRFAYFNKNVQSYRMLEWIAVNYYDLLDTPSETAEVTTQLLWGPNGELVNKGHLVAIPPHGVYEINSFHCDFDVESIEGNSHRNARYTGEFVWPYAVPDGGPIINFSP